MLKGVHPLLTGELLCALDAMGHSDAVCVADAHFPADRLGARVLTYPATGTPDLVRAICTVLPLDETPALDVMTSAGGAVLAVQQELIEAADTTDARFVERHAFYDLAAAAYLVVRTGETRTYGNTILRKGVVGQ